MPRLPLYVIADDLSGAAEIAALAHHAGLKAIVVSGAPPSGLKADVIVCDTDSRIDNAGAAARKVGVVAERIRELPSRGVFKKVDSVLRGEVVAEIEACLAAFGLERALLVPCNPSLGRIIHNGRYFIAGKPLHLTAFRRDPHHPRRSSVVEKLLPGTVGCLESADGLPNYGIVVGAASNASHVALWASLVDETIFPAGGADFFRMWLTQHKAVGRLSKAEAPSARRTLLLSGTATPPKPITPLSGPIIHLRPDLLPAANALSELSIRELEKSPTLSLCVEGATTSGGDTAKAIQKTLGQVIKKLSAAQAFDHVVLTGGTTAAQMLKAMAWSHLEVAYVWGPGVVTLRPVNAKRLLVTIKPGSYPWPLSMRRHFSPQP